MSGSGQSGVSVEIVDHSGSISVACSQQRDSALLRRCPRGAPNRGWACLRAVMCRTLREASLPSGPEPLVWIPALFDVCSYETYKRASVLRRAGGRVHESLREHSWHLLRCLVFALYISSWIEPVGLMCDFKPKTMKLIVTNIGMTMYWTVLEQ